MDFRQLLLLDIDQMNGRQLDARGLIRFEGRRRTFDFRGGFADRPGGAFLAGSRCVAVVPPIMVAAAAVPREAVPAFVF
jgi:hypothetical protein